MTFLRLCITATALCGVCASAQQVSLGDIARAERASRSASGQKVYTNDDIPSSPRGHEAPSAPSGSVPGQTDPSSQPAPPADASASKPGKDEPIYGSDDEKRVALEAEWRSKIAAQKEQIDLLQRQLEVSTRENQLLMSSYYADAGLRLRNPQQFAETQQKHQQEIQDTQKKLDDAKQQLDEMKESVRRLGLSPRVAD